MARARRPEDWAGDVTGARAVEIEVAELLRSDHRLTNFVVHTSSFEELDFSFRYRAMTVRVDVKEKRQRYSQGIRDLWPSVTEQDMFIVDETVYRRICAHSEGGLSVNPIVRAIDASSSWRARVEPYPIGGAPLPEIGRSKDHAPHEGPVV